MDKPQYTIFRFAKYKGPEISRIEAHHERTKESYDSNPDVDTSRSKDNFHMVESVGKYRAISEKRIAEVGCRTRSDSVRMVEAFVSASPHFFTGKSRKEVHAYFEEAMKFFRKHFSQENYISAVVHMDEKTPHMHFSFVPITEDRRLCAKEIVGNRKKLTQWQDKFWEHMVKKYPDLERGESASETGRKHIPPRIFKQAANLNKQAQYITSLLDGINPLNSKKTAAELEAALKKFFPQMGKFVTQTKKYDKAIRALKADNAELKDELKDASSEAFSQRMAEAQLKADYANLQRVMDRIPPEVLFRYAGKKVEQERR